ncbi:hypothetical protein BDZ88DRAFT_456309 [Geranomyces variabilis]|nr:hypothetical protein BDZ88DRAFT_456309 [Geranomyces variabilis]KAJ3140341.1 hypothetical protein HDU90_008576 [Geranomyces variabilis]
MLSSDIIAWKLLRDRRDSPSAFSTTISLADRLSEQVNVAAYLVSVAIRYYGFLGAEVPWLAAVAACGAVRVMGRRWHKEEMEATGYRFRDLDERMKFLARPAATGEEAGSGQRLNVSRGVSAG